MIKTTKLLLALILLSLGGLEAIGQNSRWSANVGLEQIFISPTLTDGIAQKEWTWVSVNGIDEYFQWRTTPALGLSVGIGFDVTKWWTLRYDYKMLWRRHYIWGSSSATLAPELAVPGQRFIMLPWADKDSGLNLRLKTWQFGTEFKHKFICDNWKLNYYLSLNFDQYRNDHHQFDRYLGYTYVGPVHLITSEIDLTAENAGEGYLVPSTSLAIGISRTLGNGMAVRADVGLRHIAWTKDFLPRNHHFVFDAEATVWSDNTKEVPIWNENFTHKFPLFIGGIYYNVTFSFRPFRSKRDRIQAPID